MESRKQFKQIKQLINDNIYSTRLQLQDKHQIQSMKIIKYGIKE
jgi:hypothetical protein